MKRSKQILLLSHCVLNQNCVINEWARARGSFQFIKDFISQGIGIIQLPCPELLFGQLSRPPKTYEEYNVPEYRKLCNEQAKIVINQVEIYVKNGYEIYGLLGIENSPTCSISHQRGVFMEELLLLLEQKNIKVNTYEVPEKWTDEYENIDDLIRGQGYER